MHVAQGVCANGLTGGGPLGDSCWRHYRPREVTFRPQRFLRLSWSPASRPRHTRSEGPFQPGIWGCDQMQNWTDGLC